jgi:hypothetical protein
MQKFVQNLQEEDVFSEIGGVEPLQPLLQILRESQAQSLSGQEIEFIIHILEVLLLALYDAPDFQKGTFIQPRLKRTSSWYFTRSTILILIILYCVFQT